MVENLLLARRNRRVAREQAEYDRLEDYCALRGLDVEEVIRKAKECLKEGVAASMNGAV